MSLPGTGMLVVATDIAEADEAEFNRWYDREHVAERVGMAGFLAARRFVAVEAAPKYLSLYETRSLDVLRSPDYQRALANQTAWSRSVMARFRNVHRLVAEVTASQGLGRGALLAAVRLVPRPAAAAGLRDALARDVLPALLERDGILAAHLLEADPELSGPPVPPEERASLPRPPAEWLLLIEGTEAGPVGRAGSDAAAACGAEAVEAPATTGTYRAMWDLSRAELDRAGAGTAA